MNSGNYSTKTEICSLFWIFFHLNYEINIYFLINSIFFRPNSRKYFQFYVGNNSDYIWKNLRKIVYSVTFLDKTERCFFSWKDAFWNWRECSKQRERERKRRMFIPSFLISSFSRFQCSHMCRISRSLCTLT